MNVVVTSCIYLSCRIEDVSRSRKEVCALGDVKSTQVDQCLDEMKIHKFHNIGRRTADTSISSTTAAEEERSMGNDQMGARFASHLEVTDVNHIKAVQHIVRRCNELHLTLGKQIAGFIGAAIYLAGRLKPEYERSYMQISVVSHMSESNIREVYGILHQHRISLVPGDFVPSDILQQLTD